MVGPARESRQALSLGRDGRDMHMVVAYAHSMKHRPITEWETLPVHARDVGEATAERAAKFQASSLGLVAGLLHDFGKYKPAFQAYLHDPKVRDKGHSSAGALYARARFGRIGLLLAHVIAGHHAGLQDGLLARQRRLEAADADLAMALAGHASSGDGFVLPGVPMPPAGLRSEDGRVAVPPSGFQWAFLTRMLFSCLVDADRLCTERFYRGAVARGPGAPVAELHAALQRTLVAAARHREGTGDSERPVNRRRAEILDHATSHAAAPRGVFTLTVPTGGGKTLTSLAFALAHAAAHGLDRVIVVIPFTSVIEQTAEVYRGALGNLAGEVLEHHSAFDEGTLKGEARQGLEKLRLDMENWDARIVVTTAVQFFESLFSNRPSQCRKLHAISRSVVILDEAQTMPLHLLRPCVAALKELARNYGTSVVLCTATQPAVLERDGEHSFAGGFRDTLELAPNVPDLFAAFRRVTVRRIGVQDDAALAERFAQAPQGLCIVNTRQHARDLHAAIDGLEGRRHLSTLMHAAHRSRVLAEIKADLVAGRPCRVVSTSLIEAGVDVDFPLVMRAPAGLDQIAQSAGRLNREGRRDAADSLLLLFEAAGRTVPKDLQTNIEAADEIMRLHGERCLEPAAIQAYFQALYWTLGGDGRDGPDDLDRFGVLKVCSAAAKTFDFPFATIAENMRFIDSVMRPIIVADDDESRHWLGELRNPHGEERLGLVARKLQRYTVGVPDRVRSGLLKDGALEILRQDTFGDQFVSLINLGLYKPDIGLDPSNPLFMEAAATIIA